MSAIDGGSFISPPKSAYRINMLEDQDLITLEIDFRTYYTLESILFTLVDYLGLPNLQAELNVSLRLPIFWVESEVLHSTASRDILF